MSIYKPKGSPFYHYDFRCGRCRVHGSTKCTNRREAEAVEKAEQAKAKQEIARATAARGSLQLDDIAGRYWIEVGQHHVGAKDTERQLDRLIKYFGKSKRLNEITDADVAAFVAWRRGHRVVRSKKQRAADAPLISNFTVNDSTECLKKLFTRAKRAWGFKFEFEPNWRAHFLPEPQERVRELMDDEGERLDAATRDDYRPFFDFARASGLRLRECLLRWDEVDWNGRQIRKRGKGGRLVTVPITSTVRQILWPLRGADPVHVFTYVARRTRDGRKKGERYPLTYSGVKTAWRRLRKRAEVTGFRFHDLRHDLATKLLRETGNLKLVQRALNHADLKTTLRYAHVLDSEVAAALERVTSGGKNSRNAKPKIA